MAIALVLAAFLIVYQAITLNRLQKDFKRYVEITNKEKPQVNIKYFDKKDFDKFAKQYEQMHDDIQETLFEESYQYAMEHYRQDTELLFTFLGKKNWTSINISRLAEPKLEVYDDKMQLWAIGTIPELYKQTFKVKP